MNKPKITVKTKKTIVENKVYDFGDYKCHETVSNGKVIEQYFTTKAKSKEAHPFTYSNKKQFRFEYSPDLDLDCVNLSYNSAYDKILNKETIIDDVENFKDFDKCYLFWLGMDGWVWKLTDKYPVENILKTFDYCGGFTNKNFDLKKILPIIKKKSWVIDAEIDPIPYYNYEEGKTNGIKFTIKFTKQLIKRIFNKSKFNSPTDEFRTFGIHECGMDIFGIKKYYKESINY